MSAGLVTAAESGFDDVAAAWSCPRPRAVLAVGSTYVATQRTVQGALAAASGVLLSFAGSARGYADRARRYEAELATDPEQNGAVETIATARQNLISLTLTWHDECRGFAAQLDGHTDVVDAALRAQPDLAGLSGYGSTAATAGFQSSPFGGAVLPDVRLGALAATLLTGRLAAMLGQYARMLAIAQSLRALADDAATQEAIDELSSLPADEAVEYWESLDKETQNKVILARPDVVALVVVAHGGTLTEDQLERLKSANAYGVFSHEFTVEVEASAGVRIVTINFDGEFETVVTKNSDGSVEMVLSVGAGAAMGADIDGGGAEGEAHGGMSGQVFQVLTFENEEEALAAIASLKAAVAEGINVFRLAPQGDQTPGTVASTGPLSAIADFLNPVDEIVGGAEAASEVAQQVDRLFDEHGVLRRYEGGIYAAGEGELDLVAIAEGEIEGEVSIGVFTTEPADGGDGDEAQTGVVISGEILGRIETDVHPEGGEAGPAVQTQESYVIEVYEDGDGDQHARIQVQVAADGGMAGEILDAAGVEVDAQAMAGARATVEVTLPVSTDLLPSLEEVVTAIPSGQIAGVAVESVIEEAEVEITVETTRTVHTENSGDLVVVAAEVETTSTDATTQVALHKYPGGPIYSQAEVDEIIDAELEADDDGEDEE